LFLSLTFNIVSTLFYTVPFLDGPLSGLLDEVDEIEPILLSEELFRTRLVRRLLAPPFLLRPVLGGSRFGFFSTCFLKRSALNYALLFPPLLKREMLTFLSL